MRHWADVGEALMTESQAPFWWLLALVGVFVFVFVLALWMKLSRREEEGRQAEIHRRDVRGPSDRD
jgi:hypothetical protein